MHRIKRRNLASLIKKQEEHTPQIPEGYKPTVLDELKESLRPIVVSLEKGVERDLNCKYHTVCTLENCLKCKKLK